MTRSANLIHRCRVFLLIISLSVGVYMLTYRAAIQSGDTRRALDAVTSTVRYGDWLMDETSWIKLPFLIRESAALPLGEYQVDERLSILLAGPLLRLAQALPRLGNIHTVWLFNVIITSLIAGIVYLTLRSMSYRDAVAVSVAISAGVGTNLWAYSQTFFSRALDGIFHSCRCVRAATGTWQERERPRHQPDRGSHRDDARLRNQILGRLRPARSPGFRAACTAPGQRSRHSRRRCRSTWAAAVPAHSDAG